MAIWSPKLRMNTMAPTKRPAARSRFCGAGAGEGRVSARAGRVCGPTDDDLNGDGDARTEGMDARGSKTHHGALAVRAGELPIDDVLETHDRLREGGMRRGGSGPRGFPGGGADRAQQLVSAHAGVYSAGGRNAVTACLGTIGGAFARSTGEPASFPHCDRREARHPARISSSHPASTPSPRTRRTGTRRVRGDLGLASCA